MNLRPVRFALAVGVFVLALGLCVWGVFWVSPAHLKINAPALAKPAGTPGVTAEQVYAPGVTAAQPTAAVRLPPSQAGVTPGGTAAAAAVAPTIANAAPMPEGDSAATGKTAPTRDASIDVNKVHLMLRDYHTLTGENPVGTNAEIMQALTGDNPKQATLGPPEGMSLNGKGELIDQWGTAYFFHQLSRDVMEIRSAGPDKVMYTPDDIVTR